jgi:Icc-related predicted phosphoesterase
MYTQEEASTMLSAFPRVDVMLVHCPPYGVNDEPDELAHQGFKGLRDYVEREHPAYLLHGHTYPSESQLVRQVGSTKIEYVYSDRVIDLALSA